MSVRGAQFHAELERRRERGLWGAANVQFLIGVSAPETMWLKPSRCAQGRQTTWKHRNLERRKVCRGPLKATGCLMPWKPPTPQKLSAKPFSRKAEGGAGWTVANVLVSEPLVLRSGHGQVDVLLWISTKQGLVSVLIRKGQFPVWMTRWISAGSSLRPDPQTLSSVIAEGARTQPTLRLLRPPKQWGWGGRSYRPPLMRTQLPWGHRGGDGERFILPQGLGPASGQLDQALEPCGKQHRPLSWDPSSPAGLRPGPQGQSWDSPLTSLSSWPSLVTAQFSPQSCPTLCNPMDCSTPGLSVHHQILEFTQLTFIELLMPSSHLILCRPFSSRLQSFRASGSFPMSLLFASSGQRIAVSASASVLPMNLQDWFPLGWTGWISLQSKGFSRVFSNTTVQKHPFFGAQFSL